ncbi:hypothetical protein [Pseudomonas putida]|uniref:hypothetical protein n=1 Tax=Pseudomonas putida TaxID=303 RepID=UPI0020C51FED|nr:hypothetical protein [Pseudomonas putida]UTL82540.1 hypothetical protein NL778_06970 [Pseudomonas putida]
MSRRLEQAIEPITPPPAPIIEMLNTYDEIDLDILGDADLAVSMEWPGIALGDKFLFHWRGADAAGQAFDIEGSYETVHEGNFDAQARRVTFCIENPFIVDADQGYAFVSCEVIAPALGPSLRRFVFVGVRVHRMEHLPVAQAVESHGLHIDPDGLGSGAATFIIPPYQAMQKGDDVKLTFQGFSDFGAEDPWTDREPVLVEADVGLPLTRRVPKRQFDFLKAGDFAQVWYQITLAAGGAPLEGPVQALHIGPLPGDRLPQLTIDDYDGGELDPIEFPKGLTLRVKAYPQLNASDWILLHVNGQPAVGFERADLSTLHGGEIVFQLDAQVLKASERLTLSYQSAREGLGLASEILDVELIDTRELAVVQVEQALSESSNKPHSFSLEANKATDGAYINVPPVDLRAGETVEVHWLGRPEAGTHIATEPVSTAWPWRFKVPASAVAANMEANEHSANKRFEVLWHIVKGQQLVQASDPVNLRILPLGTSRYPQITCAQAQGQWLSREKALREGAQLALTRWLFMATGQQLNVTFVGKQSNGSLVKILRNGLTTPAEVEAGKIELEIPKDVLTAQLLGELFEIKVSVNFENVDQQDVITVFSTLVLTMAQ